VGALAVCLLGCIRARPVSPATPGARTVAVSEGVWGHLGDSDGDDGGVGAVVTAGAAVWPGVFVGGRLAALAEFKLQIFGTDEPEESGGLLDVGPVLGLVGGHGRWAAMITAGPTLTWIDVERDGQYEQFWRPGLGADAGFSVRLVGNVGVGLGLTTNVNSERSVIGGMLRFQGSWSPRDRSRHRGER
jgi:hypothetical protein